MTRAIATDLERRGYIVYVTVSSADEEHIVKAENRVDIKALWLDLTTVSVRYLRVKENQTDLLNQTASSPSDIHPSLQEIRSLITQPQSPVAGVPPHTCQLSGVIVVPSPNYSAGPVATIPPSSWADTVNTRLLSPILTAQVFLPLLTLRNNSSTLVFAYPSISSSLSAPFAGPEVATTRAISGFADSLRQELRLLEHGNVNVVELRLGNIDLGPIYRAGQSQIAGTEVLAWSTQQRALYASQYLSSVEQRPVASVGPATVRGSPARKLHYAILDALEPTSRDMFGRKTSKKSVMYVGRGARSYSLIGAWAPSGLVALMMGYSSGNGSPSDTPSGSGSGSETSWERV
jgi:NAD(P)-dependent dehydrogenase (short-subunit alcohol dehydrogenase family)